MDWLFYLCLQVECQYAIIHATSSDQSSASYCVMYNHDFNEVPESQEKAVCFFRYSSTVIRS